ncbi:hypothetical protein [Nocardioides sp.]|uniref:hypothetical protein n=1 Tax=Nocardioides sp. TaxID=35761 RepID=UPI0035179E4A
MTTVLIISGVVVAVVLLLLLRRGPRASRHLDHRAGYDAMSRQADGIRNQSSGPFGL